MAEENEENIEILEEDERELSVEHDESDHDEPTPDGKDAERRRKDEKAGKKMKRTSKDAIEIPETPETPPAPEEVEEICMDDFEVLDDDDEDEDAPLDPNTYKLEPITPFDEKEVNLYLKTLLEEELEEYVYDAESGPRVARALAMTIIQTVHSMNFSRHKLIVVVDVVERIQQAVHSTVRFLWDTDRDNLAMATMQKDTFYAVCLVFALYYD